MVWLAPNHTVDFMADPGFELGALWSKANMLLTTPYPIILSIYFRFVCFLKLLSLISLKGKIIFCPKLVKL